MSKEREPASGAPEGLPKSGATGGGRPERVVRVAGVSWRPCGGAMRALR